jgi:hypothetical protein
MGYVELLTLLKLHAEVMVVHIAVVRLNELNNSLFHVPNL